MIQWEEHFTSVVFFPKVHYPSLVVGKHQTQHEGQSTSYLTSTPQNFQGHEDKERSRISLGQRRPRRHGD